MTERYDKPMIDRLWVLHWPYQAGAAGLPAQSVAPLRTSGVLVDTCMRQLLFGTGPGPAINHPETSTMEKYSGVKAYRLLLEVVTGLRSTVCGETNVYGQFRRAWQESLDRLPASITQPLSPLVESLLSDARRIRQQHLQGVGGNSYGSLARRLLAPARGARVLFVGTGELARSMLPFFRATETGAWNHRPVTPPDVDHWFSTTQADSAAGWAEHIIFTTPADAEHDAGWQRRLQHGRVRSLLHLGQRRGEALRWTGVETAFDLDDILGAAEARAKITSLQLVRARSACHELASARFPVARPDDDHAPLLISARG
ncbi:MAG: hypothetical protein KDI87_05830 [Gammaproteobacteria bacterium]|nr:hypothetical protein [Gammaproteobacteria bacterium]